MFDEKLIFLIKKYCDKETRPEYDREWYAVWTTMLSTMFPIADGYVVEPHIRRNPPKGKIEGQLEVILEVCRITENPFMMYPVLVVKMEMEGVDFTSEQILQQLDVDVKKAFCFFGEPVFWIAAVGPRWIYGTRMEEMKALEPLIEWHNSLIDEKAQEHFKALIRLVHTLDPDSDTPPPEAAVKYGRKVELTQEEKEESRRNHEPPEMEPRQLRSSKRVLNKKGK